MRRSSLQAVLNDNPDVCIGMLEMLCRRVRNTTSRVEDHYLALDFPARLARCLLLVARSLIPGAFRPAGCRAPD